MNRISLVCGAALAAAAFSSPATAITSKDVMEKMSKDQRFGYLTGLIDMLAYRELLAGNKVYAQCLSDAWYKNDKMPDRLIAALYEHGDKAPEGIVYLLMTKACSSPLKLP